MIENAKFEILRKLAQESKKNPELLLRTAHGYRIYAAYDLMPYKHQVLVIEPGGKVYKFNTMKSALRYCTALKYQDFPAAQHIQQLDQQLGRAQSDIEIHMLRIQDHSNIELHEAKLSSAKTLRENAKIHLDKYPIIAKYLQTKRIHPHETHRSST